MKESMITVSLGRRKLEVARGTLVGDLAAMAPEAKDAVVARVDNDVMGFQFPLMRDCWVEFLTPILRRGCGPTGPAWCSFLSVLP